MTLEVYDSCEADAAIVRAHKRKGNHVTIRDDENNVVIWKYPDCLSRDEARALLLLKLHGELRVVNGKVFSGVTPIARYPIGCNPTLALGELIIRHPMTASFTLADRGEALLSPRQDVTLSVPESRLEELRDHLSRFFPEVEHDLTGPVV